LVLAFGLTDFVSNTIKHTLKNPRPNHVESLYSIKRVEGGSGYSTPSSHAANHMAIAICASAVLGLAWGWRLLLFAWAILIGFSRVYNGVHFPSDVLIGFALGGLIAMLCYFLYKKVNNRIYRSSNKIATEQP
jgi:undecaprenyl-diphosphatase